MSTVGQVITFWHKHSGISTVMQVVTLWHEHCGLGTVVQMVTLCHVESPAWLEMDRKVGPTTTLHFTNSLQFVSDQMNQSVHDLVQVI